MAGGGLGGLFAGPAGAGIGSSLAGHVATFLGMGAYKVKMNSLVSNPPLAMHKTTQDVTVRHREYVGDVVSAGTANTFVVKQYQLNPGLASTFPWLSQLALLYQEYTFKGLIFEFVSTSADAIASSTNTSLGSVIMATTYRNSVTFLSKGQMNNEMFANDAKPSCSFIHPVECDPAENPFNVQYVRGGAVPAGEDIKSFDLGTFNIASAGVQGTNVVLGELWCTYEVTLRKPVLSQPTGLGLSVAQYSFVNPASATPFSGPAKVYDSIGLSFSTTAVLFPQGLTGAFFLVTYYTGGAASNTHFSTLTGTNGLTASSIAFAPVDGVTSANHIEIWYVVIVPQSGLNPTLTVSGAALPTSPAGLMYVFQSTDP